jgi:hypothetical protein
MLEKHISVNRNKFLVKLQSVVNSCGESGCSEGLLSQVQDEEGECSPLFLENPQCNVSQTLWQTYYPEVPMNAAETTG